MKPILTDLSPTSLVAAMENIFHGVFVEHGRRSGRTDHLGDAASWVMVAPAAWPSVLFGARFEPEGLEEGVRDIIGLIERGEARSSPPGWARVSTSGSGLDHTVGSALTCCMHNARDASGPTSPSSLHSPQFKQSNL